MKRLSSVLGVFALSVAAAPALAQAPPMVECESPSSRVKAVTFNGLRLLRGPAHRG